MRASGYYPQPIHGVSTMPGSTVLYGYARIQENLRSDPIEKLKRRPPLKAEGVLLAIGDGTEVRHVTRRNGVEYEVLVKSTGEVVGFIDGVQKTTVGTLVPYIQTGDGADIDMVTVNDTIFVINRTKVVAMNTFTDASAGAVKNVSYINVTAAMNYVSSMVVTVKRSGSVLGSVTHTVQGLVGGDYNTADGERATAAIATSIYNKLAAVALAWAISPAIKGSCVSIQSNNGVWLDIEISTGQSISNATVINQTIETIDGLPLYAQNGTVVKVQPDPNVTKGSYYLRATRTATVATTGMEEVLWAETRSPTEPYSLNAATMPYTITFSGSNVNVGQPVLGWDERQAGDNNSVRVPKFVGGTIKRIGYMQTRLLVLSANDAVSTRTDNIYDWWRASAVSLLVTDPISMASNAVNVDTLQHMLPHNKDMLITGTNAQFKVTGATRLSPDTAAMALTTSIEIDTTAKPVSMGNSIFFPARQGDNSAIIEYTGQKDTTQDKGQSITDHVTGMLKGAIIKMVANSNNEMLIVKTAGSPDNVLYIYEQFTDEKGQKTQKSWSKWVFPDNINVQDIHLEFNKLSIVSLEDNVLLRYAIYIDAKVAIEKDTTIFLDNKIILPTTGLGVELPVWYTWNVDNVVAQGDGCNSPLYQVEYEYDSDLHSLIFDEDVGAGDVHIGLIVPGVYQPNRPYRRNKEGRVLTEEKIRIANIYVEVSDSYAGAIEIDSKLYPPNRFAFTGELVGQAVVGVKTPFTGSYDYPFAKDADLANIKVTTEGYLGLTITGLRWRGQYTRLTTII